MLAWELLQNTKLILVVHPCIGLILLEPLTYLDMPLVLSRIKCSTRHVL